MTWLRDRLDARALDRALRVFYRRQWHDLPDARTATSVTVTQLEQRIATLRPVCFVCGPSPWWKRWPRTGCTHPRAPRPEWARLP